MQYFKSFSGPTVNLTQIFLQIFNREKSYSAVHKSDVNLDFLNNEISLLEAC